MPTETLFANRALLPEGWADNVAIRFDPDVGGITAVERDAAPGGDHHAAILLPGMPNLHSHAFQRAMAGLAERAGGTDDSFWTWRQTMYGLVSRLDPDQIGAIATRLYAELLTQGYTAIAEFHYLHNRPDGGHYDEPAETALQVVRAAQETGMAITLLPVLYDQGGFDGAPLSPAQQRFRGDPEFLASVAAAATRHFPDFGWLRTGLAIHSLRAASVPAIEGAAALQTDGPIHIHIAEQVREVAECYDWSGKTPVEWLLDNMPVDERWCLVHATNVTGEEVERMAASGAVAGLCPTTEANLGDGIFPLRDFLDNGGRFGIGSDSHISVSPVEELRWLEYGQRLAGRRRNVATAPDNPSVGGTLWRAALTGGARALGQNLGAVSPGHRADFILLDEKHLLLEGREGDDILDALVFAGNDRLVQRVMAGGKWVVEGGRHVCVDEITEGYRKAVAALRKEA